MQKERSQARRLRLRMLTAIKKDVAFEVTEDKYPNNLRREVWSPWDFDKKYMELAQHFLEQEDDPAA